MKLVHISGGSASPGLSMHFELSASDRVTMNGWVLIPHWPGGRYGQIADSVYIINRV